ncbi:hypothetical protein [Alicyclobacillus fodiniaquatilis]|uniref:Uncharacterized protein n=1 Tax=Alicyclobacillus fodiniaquatilis TaxID=1661150 RepID=A0ABW4JG12_9BACL
MNHFVSRAIRGFVACSLVFIICIQESLASTTVTCRTEQHVLNEIQLAKRYQVLHVVVHSPYAYILSISPDKELCLHLAFMNKEGKWRWMGSDAMPMTDNRPWRLFRSKYYLKYSSSRASGYRYDMDYQFDWCLSGYTTDAKVTRFRIKTKTGYIPLESIHGRYFMRVLTEEEHASFVEVQGLNAKGDVIQRDNGELEGKPRQWSPQHSELY